MGIRNFIAEFQDYFFIKRPILERLEENSLSSSNLELSYKQAESIMEEFKTNLEFLDVESIEVLKEINEVMNSLENKIDKINRYADAIKEINTTADESESVVYINPYQFDITSKYWEHNSKCYMLEPKSSYVIVKPYTYATDPVSKKGLSKFVIDTTFSTKYILIKKPRDLNINNIVYLNTAREVLKAESIDVNSDFESNILTIPSNTKFVNIEYTYDSSHDFSITPLSFYHHPAGVLSLESVNYKVGDLLLFNAKKEIPFGCYLQIMLSCTFKDTNNNILSTEEIWYPIDNDGMVVLKKEHISTEVPKRVWKEGSFKDITNLDTVPDNSYVLCKPTYPSTFQVNTESSFSLSVKNAKTVTIQPTLYMYSLLNETLTPKLFSLTGIIKNESKTY